MKQQGVDCEIHVITGSVEISPGIGLADGIFDIVSSGSTLVSNNLREVEVVMQSEALLIGNKNLSADKRATLEEMLFRFKAVKDAEDKKYVRMNAPKARLQEIINVLPGLKSLCAHGAGPEALLGDYRQTEGNGCPGHLGDTH